MHKSNYIYDRLISLRNKIRTGRIKQKHVLTATRYADQTWSAMKEGMRSLGNEVSETEEMARSFFRILEQKLRLNERDDPPSEEEVKRAIQQLKDVGRFSFFATMVILPGGVISLIGLELIAKKLGLKDFTLVPTSFRKKKEQEKQDDKINKTGSDNN